MALAPLTLQGASPAYAGPLTRTSNRSNPTQSWIDGSQNPLSGMQNADSLANMFIDHPAFNRMGMGSSGTGWMALQNLFNGSNGRMLHRRHPRAFFDSAYGWPYADWDDGQPDPWQLFELMGLFPGRRSRDDGQSDPWQMLELMGLYPPSRSRRTPRIPNGFFAGFFDGDRHHRTHTDLNVDVNHHFPTRHRCRGLRHTMPIVRDDYYYLSDDTDCFESDTESEFDDRTFVSYVRRRPRQHRHHHRHHRRSHRASWSPSFPDLDGFRIWGDGWSRGRPRHRNACSGRPRDGSYSEVGFSLR